MSSFDLSFYKGRKVLVTGHTGFKGSWMCRVLTLLGADVCGYALDAPTEPSLFDIAGIGDGVSSVIGDVRDFEHLKAVFDEFKPEIVIHMAAQPIVRESYKDPRYTYETNVMGTVNVLECCRLTPSVKSIVNVTTDKVYRNDETGEAFAEDLFLDGYDPYSNSKSCSELVSATYRRCWFDELDIPMSTCRAGNVIGGGDFATDRIIPDCFRAASAHSDIIVRNPYSTRPYQHVLEPVVAYLVVAMEQYRDHALAGAYNIGPDDESCINTGGMTDLFCAKWEKYADYRPVWINKHDGGPHEAGFLKLDNTKFKQTFGYGPVWDIDTAVDKTVEWYAIYASAAGEAVPGDVAKGDRANAAVTACMDRQIQEFTGEIKR